MPKQLVVVTIDLDPSTGLPHAVDGGATVNGVTVVDKGDTVLFAVAPTWPSGLIEFADETPIGQMKTRPGILHEVVRPQREGGAAHNRYRYACTLSNGAVELKSPAGAIGGGEIEIKTRV